MRFSFLTTFTASILLWDSIAGDDKINEPSKSGREPVELDDGTICVEGYIMDKVRLINLQWKEVLFWMNHCYARSLL